MSLIATENDSTQYFTIANLNGLRFCPRCDMLLKPIDLANDVNPPSDTKVIMRFTCSQCGDVNVLLDKDSEEEYVAKRVEYHRQQGNEAIDKNMILEPSMMRVKIECAKCGYGYAVAQRSVDEKKSQINVQYICASITYQGDIPTPACYYSWSTDVDAKDAEGMLDEQQPPADNYYPEAAAAEQAEDAEYEDKGAEASEPGDYFGHDDNVQGSGLSEEGENIDQEIDGNDQRENQSRDSVGDDDGDDGRGDDISDGDRDDEE